MKIVKVWFKDDHIYGECADGKVVSQSLLWYPKLAAASDGERMKYVLGTDGIHWRELDEDISFESFGYDDAEPSELQRFFLTHKEMNVGELAARIGLNATLLRNYINGFKKPSAAREKYIVDSIRSIGEEYVNLGRTSIYVDGYTGHETAEVSLCEGQNTYGEKVKRPFCELMRTSMAERRLNQSKLADMVGISQARISNFCRGKAEPSLGQAVRIAGVLEIDMNSVLC